MPESSLHLPGTVPDGIFLVCIDCFSGTWVDAVFPLVLATWGDLPLPEGWVMTARVVKETGNPAHVSVPMCTQCAAKLAMGEEELMRAQDRARDLKDDQFISSRPPRG